MRPLQNSMRRRAARAPPAATATRILKQPPTFWELAFGEGRDEAAVIAAFAPKLFDFESFELPDDVDNEGRDQPPEPQPFHFELLHPHPGPGDRRSK
jgi:hypothetical protein